MNAQVLCHSFPCKGTIIAAADMREDAWSDIWPKLQAELAELSTNTDWRVSQEASHYIPLDAPEAIAVAMSDVVIAHREDSPVRQAEQ